MKRMIAALIVAGALVSLPACGNDDTNTETATRTSNTAESTTVRISSVTSTADLGMIDQAKLAAFVVAFRTAYADLSQDRDDESIQEIVSARATPSPTVRPSKRSPRRSGISPRTTARKRRRLKPSRSTNW
ncbi:hypothetical protein [Rhodococcus globerulus]|uniref:hypothetical protein n=1 Tax=Rhodococcus globerulus TaxID=33008 RepID=UPI000B2AAC09|nr:hypothetical protein [Rhodococcus globerulus]